MSEAEKLQNAVVYYLKSNGWEPIVVGEVVIQQQPSQRKYIYEVVVQVTAKPPQELKP